MKSPDELIRSSLGMAVIGPLFVLWLIGTNIYCIIIIIQWLSRL